MQKTLLSITVAVSLGVTALYFFRQAHAERERADEQTVRVQTLEEEVALLRRHASLPSAANGNAGRSSTFVVGAPAQLDGHPSPSEKGRCGPEDMRLYLEQQHARGQESQRQYSLKTLQDPQLRQRYREFLVNKLFRPAYQELFDEHKFSQVQVDQVMDALAEQQMSKLKIENTQTDPQAIKAAQEALQRETDSTLQALLGGKYLQYQNYQRTFQERESVRSYNEYLVVKTGAGLQPDQRKKIMAELIKDRQENPQPDIDDTPGGALKAEDMGRLSAWREERDKRMLMHIKSILTAEQYKKLQEAL